MTVPRRYLVVWMGEHFPFTAALALRSLRNVDRQAPIDLHLLGEPPRTPHFTSLSDELDIRVRPVNLNDLMSPWPGLHDLFQQIPQSAASARSNLLRYLLLHRDGGVYVDLDVLVRRPLHDLAGGNDFVGVERVWRFDRARVEGRWDVSMLPGTVGWAVLWWLRKVDTQLTGGRLGVADRVAHLDRRFTTLQPNNAVIGASEGSPFMAELLRRAQCVDPGVRYALGPSLLADTVEARPGLMTLLPESVLYPVPPAHSFRFFDDVTLQLPDDTALIHYVQSNHVELLRSIERYDRRFANAPGVFWRWGAVALNSALDREAVAA